MRHFWSHLLRCSSHQGGNWGPSQIASSILVFLSMDGMPGRVHLFTTSGPPAVIADFPFTEGDIYRRSLTLIAS